MKTISRVGRHPAKPLMIYDGECNFCVHWIDQCKKVTQGMVDYLASQDPEVNRDYPEIPESQFSESVQLIDLDGTVYDGAEAVVQALKNRAGLSGFAWAYENLPGAKELSEAAYKFVSEHRQGLSKATKMIFGEQS